MLNYYALLRVSEDSTHAEITRAFITEVPNAHPSWEGHRMHLLEVTEAYLVLSDPVRRHVYDTLRKHDDFSVSAEVFKDTIIRARREAEECHTTSWAMYCAWALIRLDVDLTHGNDYVLRQERREVNLPIPMQRIASLRPELQDRIEVESHEIE
jgi:curved DNA-binding protein CbpA